MRKISHMQKHEPMLEHVLSWKRFQIASSKINKGAIVADFGCGYNANFLRKISRKIKNGVGYDVSVTNKNLPENIILKKVNLNEKIDGNKRHFDLITALAVLEHVENPSQFVNQAKVMLKKGGHLILSTPHKRSKSLLEFLSYRLNLISTDEIYDHKNYFDEISLRKLLKENGFKKIKIKTFEMGLNLFSVAEKT